MNLEGQVRERNLNPKNACLKRRPELGEALAAFAESSQNGQQPPEPQDPHQQVSFVAEIKCKILIRILVSPTVVRSLCTVWQPLDLDSSSIWLNQVIPNDTTNL